MVTVSFILHLPSTVMSHASERTDAQVLSASALIVCMYFLCASSEQVVHQRKFYDAQFLFSVFFNILDSKVTIRSADAA